MWDLLDDVLELALKAVGWLLQMCWRFVTGGLLVGRDASDSRFHRPASTGTGWSAWPGYKRAAVRLVLLTVVALWFTTRLAAIIALVVLSLAGAAWLTWWVPNWLFLRRVLRPFWLAAAPYLGRSTAEDPRRWLDFPRDLQADDVELAIALPDSFQDEDRVLDRLDALVNKRIEGGPWRSTRDYLDRVVIYRRPPDPPRRVDYDAIPGVHDLPETKIPMAGALAGKVIYADLANDTPHLLVAGATGDGKTTVLTTASAHLASRGAWVTMIDPKVAGTKHLRQFPNIRIMKVPEFMRDAVLALADEVQRRYELDDQGVDIENRRLFPTQALVTDEYSSFILRQKVLQKRLIAEWREDVKECKKLSAPWPDEPRDIEEAILTILEMGRACRVYMITGTHQANRAIFPFGTESRQAYGWRLALGHPEDGSWRMLAGGPIPRPKVAKRKGAGVVVRHDETSKVQCTIIADPDDPTAAADSQALARLADRARQVLRERGQLTAAGQLVLPSENAPVPAHIGMCVPPAGTTPAPVAAPAVEVPGAATAGPGEAAAPAASAPPAPGPEARPALRLVRSPEETPLGDLCVGWAAAAAFLGIEGANPAEALERAAKRARKAGTWIPETRHGQSPAWRKDDLLTWQSDRPIAGKRLRS
jgi:DNA translocase FtsK/SpoIIIE-like protein